MDTTPLPYVLKEGEAETLEIREDMVKSKQYDPEVDRLERKILGDLEMERRYKL